MKAGKQGKHRWAGSSLSLRISEPDFQKTRFPPTRVALDGLAHFFHEARQISLVAAYELVGNVAFGKINGPRLNIFER